MLRGEKFCPMYVQMLFPLLLIVYVQKFPNQEAMGLGVSISALALEVQIHLDATNPSRY